MSEMAAVKLKYVQAFPDRYGKMRYYFRRRGFSLVTLPGEPGSVEFAEAYQAALKMARPAATSVTEGPRSMGALIAQYYLHSDFTKKAGLTQATYRNVLERFRDKYGKFDVIHFTPDNLDAIFETMSETPAQASNLRKRLKTVFQRGVKLRWIKANPILATEKIAYRSKGFTPWSEAEIEKYQKFWPSGSNERFAMELMLCTALRRSDAVLAGSQHLVRGGSHISVVQVKGGGKSRIEIPIHPDLSAEITLRPKGMTFLVTQYGRPFTAKGFTKWFVAKAKAAGLEGRTPHGLRKAQGRRMAEAGCSEKEIAAMLGHSSPATAQVYTRDADQKRLADSAATKTRGTEQRTKVSNGSEG